eukprot:430580-Amphidinium_carterae.1
MPSCNLSRPFESYVTQEVISARAAVSANVQTILRHLGFLHAGERFTQAVEQEVLSVFAEVNQKALDVAKANSGLSLQALMSSFVLFGVCPHPPGDCLLQLLNLTDNVWVLLQRHCEEEEEEML